MLAFHKPVFPDISRQEIKSVLQKY